MRPIIDETKAQNNIYHSIETAEPYRYGDGFLIRVEGHTPLVYTRYECEVLIGRMQNFLYGDIE